MKPNWNSAPSWADYLVQDGLGRWHWCQLRPVATPEGWYFGGAHIVACVPNSEWRETMEDRP